MDEIWRAVPGWEGRYEVSNLGRVKSLKGTPKIRKLHIRSGYLSVLLFVGRVGTNRLVHSLVLDAFAGPKPDGCICLHGAGGRLDNRPENLRYGTHADNGADMVRDGNSLQGEKHHQAKLTEAQVIAIRADRRGERRLARLYGVSRGTIGFIKQRKTWRHLPLDVPQVGVSSLS